MAKDMDARLVIDASGPPLEAALNEGVYLFKPSLHELQELLRAPLEDQEAWIDASVNLVQAGRAEIVALTLGERGALLATRDHVLRGQPLPINPVNTVGAGDSFLGGIVWSIASGHGLDDAFRYGNAAGSAAVLAPGTELCRREDVERLYREVVVETIWERRPTAE